MDCQDRSDHPPPDGILTLQTVAMPKDANPSGDIFGGWLVAQMDLAAGVVAAKRARGRTVTVAIDALRFHKPVFVGDVVTCYAKIVRVGTTSMGIRVDTWVSRSAGNECYRVTEGILTFVAIAEDRRPRPLPPED